MKVIAAILVAMVAGCEQSPSDIAPCAVRRGEFVQSILDGRRGMIIYRSDDSDYVTVRFPSPQVSEEAHMLGSGGPLEPSPYADVHMECFEFHVSPFEGRP